ncbi:hypothetical protein J4441_05890 [Candidatus Micrarchaeota archaeon]|nr:hypothetical protein [Candidatus Micrarchaeota archaeon]
MKNNAIFALLMLVFAAGFAFADLSLTSYEILPSSLEPGVSGTIVLGIKNVGTSSANGILMQASANSQITTGGSFSFGDLASGATTTLTVPFSISQGAKSGVYPVSLRFTWISSSSTANSTRTAIFNIPLEVSRVPSFSLETIGTSAFSSRDFLVNATITNTKGFAVSDVRISLNTSDFLQKGQVPLSIGTVNYTHTFSLPLTSGSSVSSGDYEVPLLISYRDEVGVEHTASGTLVVDVTVSSPKFLASASSSEPLTQGMRSRLSISLANNGDDSAQDVRVSISNSSVLTPLGFSEVSAGMLAEGASSTVSFDVGVNDILPGFYSLPLLVRYTDQYGKESTATITTGIFIESKNDLSVYISSKPAPIVSGGVHTLSVLVSNIGSSPIKALSVRMSSSAFSLLEAQEDQFIGGLNQDDFSTVQYKVLVGSVPEGDYALNVTLSFKDSYNKPHTLTVPAYLRVVSQQTAAAASGMQNGLDLPVLIGGLIVLAVIAYFVRRRYFAKKHAATAKTHQQ